MSEIMVKDKEYIAGTYNRFPVEICRGKGSEVYDTAGKRYIDMTSGIGVTLFGTADDEWVAAVSSQAAKLQHMSNLFYTSPCVELAEILCKKTGMKKVFFSNSGAEANECAIKAARKYAAKCKGEDHYTIVTVRNGFHGRTITTLAATGQDHYHELYRPLTSGFEYVPANDIAAIENAVAANKTAAVMLECIQGEGGVLPLDGDYIKAAAGIAQRENVLLIIDEVQTGNGRTGKLYSYMNFGIDPDIVTTAKGLGGGLPIGATLFGSKTADIFEPGDHGSTYGGNPVCCAGAVSVINRLTDEFLVSVTEKGRLARKLFEGRKGILSVSGMGLMIGLETVKPAADVVRECIGRGVLCLTAKNKVRLLPALNIPAELLTEAAETIASVCGEGI